MTKVHSTQLTGLALASEGAAPDWVQLTPAGPDIPARDGRRFRLTDPDRLVRAFEANEADLPIDVEHASETRANNGLDAPAYGWIKRMEVRQGAVWGQVEWSAKATEWIADKAYRYLSPTFLYDKDTLEMLAIRSAGLTNGPAFKMTALARAEDTLKTETAAMSEKILKELGLASGASDDDAVSAIQALRQSVATAKAQPDPDKYVAKAHYDATAAELKRLREADEVRIAQAQEALVDGGIKAGKILPVTRDDFVATAKAVGAERFEKMVAAMPVIGTAQAAPTSPVDGGVATGGLSAEEIAVARALGQPVEHMAVAKKAYPETAK